MILLDTHIWVWWIQRDPCLPTKCVEYLDSLSPGDVAINVISSWEIAVLHSHGRLRFTVSLGEWMERAVTQAGITVLPITPILAVESVQLPGEFHKDPADRILVATSRIRGVPLVTADRKILSYPFSKSIHPVNISPGVSF